ncbi:MAG: dihydroneopterin aldolase [Prevotellaceae bacterium]|jgi:dihydroneopterin aldolase|nr:dihydroneopterin aldolase [Prevotellaceae bacterium]
MKKMFGDNKYMGIIEIENMEFFAHHGCYEAERIRGNTFLVTLRIETDMKLASESDNIGDAVNYQTAYDIVRDEMMIPSNLLENVCFRILNALYDKMTDIKKATVKVSKLNPAIAGKIEKTSVTQSR